jgi:hypothetical protein
MEKKDYKLFDKTTLKPNSNALKEYSTCLPSLDTEQIGASPRVGMILGDASLQKQSVNYRIKYDLTNKNRPYADHIINLLDGYIIGESHIKARSPARQRERRVALVPEGEEGAFGEGMLKTSSFKPLAIVSLINLVICLLEMVRSVCRKA